MSKENPCKPACECGENLGKAAKQPPEGLKEINGFRAKNLPEPTRYGDWEVGGRCSDF